MGVDHYDDVYGESLAEHATAELSPEVATIFRADGAMSFSEPAKTVLVSAVQRAIEERDLYLTVLEREQDSLETGHRALANLLDEHEGPQVADWYRPEFEHTLDDIATQRQETIQDRMRTYRTDEHDLCSCLYSSYDWTYPVLTAVTRFRRAVVWE